MNMHDRRGGSLLSFLAGLAIGAGIGFFVLPAVLAKPTRPAPAAAKETPSAGVRSAPTRPPAPGIEKGPAVVRDDDWFQRKLREWGLSPDDLRRMSDNAGEAISRKGARLGEMASDVRIIAVVKAKFTLDDHLSGWDITVGCADGHVTLGGMVDSPEAIGRAIVLALDTEGVADVVSSLRVRPPAPQGNS
jgi:hypothetical protein